MVTVDPQETRSTGSSRNILPQIATWVVDTSTNFLLTCNEKLLQENFVFSVWNKPRRDWERSWEKAGTIRSGIHDGNNSENKMAATVRRETSWRRRWKPNLNSQPWKHFSILGKSFLVKSMFFEMDCSYEFCLWDFSTFWYEKVEQDQFRVRAKVYYSAGM